MPRPREGVADRRRQILDAALRVFARHGYAATTNAQIAREAGVTAAALYYYFPSKAELFRAVVSERQSLLRTELQKLQAWQDRPPEEVLPLVIGQVARVFAEERSQALLRILLAEGPRDPQVAQIWVSHFVNPIAEAVRAYVNHQVQRQCLRPIDPRVAHLLVAGPLFAAFVHRDLLGLSYLKDLETDQLIEQLVQALLYGLRRAG